MNITIYGAGYVGLSNGLLLARKNNVNIIDVNSERINSLIDKTILLEENLSNEELKSTKAIFSIESIFENIDVFILALPTNYNEISGKFDTSILDEQIRTIRNKYPETPIIIKSTIPVGYTDSFEDENIIFSPEFLREGTSFYDSLNPSRIIIGSKLSKHKKLGNLFMDNVLNSPELLFMSSTEAESVKLFSNTYLAMRVSYVNELSNFASKMGMKTSNILRGVGLDPRIGNHYFSPSTGYGGYCLPKDSKQLVSEFKNQKIQNVLFDAIVKSNDLRIDSLVQTAIDKDIKKIYINGIGHKPGVINQRESTKLKFAQEAKAKGINVIFVDSEGIVKGFDVVGTPPLDYVNIEDIY